MKKGHQVVSTDIQQSITSYHEFVCKTASRGVCKYFFFFLTTNSNFPGETYLYLYTGSGECVTSLVVLSIFYSAD